MPTAVAGPAPSGRGNSAGFAAGSPPEPNGLSDGPRPARRPPRRGGAIVGNYRQHVGLAGFVGVLYAWGAYVGVGIHWLYGSVAALLATLGGLLPDLDHPIGVELKGFTGI